MDWLALLFVLASPFIVTVAWRSHRLNRGGIVSQNGWMNRAAHRWHKNNVRLNERLRRQRSEQYGSGGQKLTASRPAIADFDDGDDLDDVEERLSEAFERYKEGDLSIEGYAREVRLEDPDNPEVRWRLDWVNKRLRDEKLYQEHPEISGSGRWARFEYVDHYGDVTNREIVNWEVAGRYVRGFDRKRKAQRNFRIDRISDWVAGA